MFQYLNFSNTSQIAAKLVYTLLILVFALIAKYFLFVILKSTLEGIKRSDKSARFEKRLDTLKNTVKSTVNAVVYTTAF